MKRRTTRRRYAGKTRSRISRRSTTNYRRRRPTRKRMSTRRILNVSTHKKRDTMVHNNTTASPTDPSLLLPNQTNCIPFVPTARPRVVAGTYQADNSRVSDHTYAKGYAETFTIQTNSPDPWSFRYVAFTYKGDFIITAPGTQFYSVDPVPTTASQMTRTAGVYQPSTVSALEEVLFKGQKGSDWTSEQIAPLDTTRVKVLKDYRFIVRSGNDSGTTVRKKVWVPCNKILQYAGDEETFGTLSTAGFPGMGDLYIVMFSNVGGSAVTTSRATILFNGTYYWHEK